MTPSLFICSFEGPDQIKDYEYYTLRDGQMDLTEERMYEGLLTKDYFDAPFFRYVGFNFMHMSIFNPNMA